MNSFISATIISKKLLYVFLINYLIFFFTSSVSAQRIRYVSADACGKKDGSSWTNASSNLHRIINLSKPGDQIWLASNFDKPTCYTKVVSADKYSGVKSYIMTMCTSKTEKPSTYIFMDPHKPVRIPRYTFQVLKSNSKQNPPIYIVMQIV